MHKEKEETLTDIQGCDYTYTFFKEKKQGGQDGGESQQGQLDLR